MKLREIERMVEAAGLEIISTEKNCHHKVRVRRADGRESVQVFACTPSDKRGALNRMAALKRFARGEG